MLPNLFEAYIQADASISQRFGGTGIGLAITRKFCALLGGAIRVTSKLGEGSTFTVDLPAHLSESEAVGGPEPAQSLLRPPDTGLSTSRHIAQFSPFRHASDYQGKINEHRTGSPADHHETRDKPAAEAAPRILVVDDVADNREILTRRLVRRGFEVSEAVCARTPCARLLSKLRCRSPSTS